jgi:hypothetical protein
MEAAGSWYLCTEVHGIISQKTIILMFTPMRASDIVETIRVTSVDEIVFILK